MENLVNEIKRKMLNLDGFGFLSYRVKNYNHVQRSAKYNSAKNIKKFILFFNDHFIGPFLLKYVLKIIEIKLESVDSPQHPEFVFPKFEDPTVESHSLDRKIAIYKKKEETNLSDLSYSSFIKLANNFTSLRFINECKYFLNTEFDVKKNAFGSYIEPELKIRYFFNIFKDRMIILCISD